MYSSRNIKFNENGDMVKDVYQHNSMIDGVIFSLLVALLAGLIMVAAH